MTLYLSSGNGFSTGAGKASLVREGNWSQFRFISVLHHRVNHSGFLFKSRDMRVDCIVQVDVITAFLNDRLQKVVVDGVENGDATEVG